MRRKECAGRSPPPASRVKLEVKDEAVHIEDADTQPALIVGDESRESRIKDKMLLRRQEDVRRVEAIRQRQAAKRLKYAGDSLVSGKSDSQLDTQHRDEIRESSKFYTLHAGFAAEDRAAEDRSETAAAEDMAKRLKPVANQMLDALSKQAYDHLLSLRAPEMLIVST